MGIECESEIYFTGFTDIYRHRNAAGVYLFRSRLFIRLELAERISTRKIWIYISRALCAVTLRRARVPVDDDGFPAHRL